MKSIAYHSFFHLASQSSSVLSKSLVLSSLELKPLILIYPLEKIYRARYKSDYFPQNGIVRRPRYIADNAANHFITLQVDILSFISIFYSSSSFI